MAEAQLELGGSQKVKSRGATISRSITNQLSRHFTATTGCRITAHLPYSIIILRQALSLVTSKASPPKPSPNAKQSGYLEITHNLFPHGPFSIVEYHFIKQLHALISVPLEHVLALDGRFGRSASSGYWALGTLYWAVAGGRFSVVWRGVDSRLSR
jgi:hypothetical protein